MAGGVADPAWAPIVTGFRVRSFPPNHSGDKCTSFPSDKHALAVVRHEHVGNHGPLGPQISLSCAHRWNSKENIKITAIRYNNTKSNNDTAHGEDVSNL